MGYETGKPVIMVEGNALWVRYWITVKNRQGTAALLDEKAYRTGQYTLGGRKQTLDIKSLPSGAYVIENKGVVGKKIKC